MAARFIAFTLATLLAGSAARAGEVQDLARQAETGLEAGKHAEAIADLRQALFAAMDSSPLAFQRAHFVRQKADGYGQYHLRPDNVFKLGEKLHVYAEPFGFGWQKQGVGVSSELVADFILRTPQGTVLLSQQDFGRFRSESHHRHADYYVSMTYTLSGLKPGQYVIATTLRDQVSGKTGSFDLPFEVVEE